MVRGRWLNGLVLVGVMLGPACGPGGPGTNTTNITPSDAGHGGADAGASLDAGSTGDAGASDAGTTDAGFASDAGTPPLPVTLPPSTSDWRFFGGPQMAGPNTVLGASYDDGSNLWVAGGEEGLFLLRPGASKFERFTMADGLRPYGYMPDGSDPAGSKYLKVLSVSGAGAGTVFVGYHGKPGPGGELECEGNWDGPNPDPSIYKSGDADKVTLTATGISVVHYDIFSGPGIVGGELRGREKLCNILRIRYDKANDKVWFGGNHGFAMGEASYQGNASCEWEASINPPPPAHKTDPFSNEYGHKGCNGVLEHTHPAFNGYHDDTSSVCCAYLTGGYYGVSVDPVTRDVWFGGQMRTTKFHYASSGNNYFAAESQTEDPQFISNRIDIWPDRVGEPNYPRPADRVDDLVSGAAAMHDGTVWLSSFKYGLAHLDSGGGVSARVSTSDGLFTNKLSAVAADPGDQSVWAGANSGGGVTRMRGGSFQTYDGAVFGLELANEGISDLQMSGAGNGRLVVVSFAGDKSHAGAVGVYSGP